MRPTNKTSLFIFKILFYRGRADRLFLVQRRIVVAGWHGIVLYGLIILLRLDEFVFRHRSVVIVLLLLRFSCVLHHACSLGLLLWTRHFLVYV